MDPGITDALTLTRASGRFMTLEHYTQSRENNFDVLRLTLAFFRSIWAFISAFRKWHRPNLRPAST